MTGAAPKAGPPRALLAFALVSVLGHAAVLSGWQERLFADAAPSAGATRRQAAPPVTSVRLLDGRAMAGAKQAAIDDGGPVMGPSAVAIEPAIEPVAPLAAAPRPDDPPGTVDATSSADDAPYLPRQALDQAPVALAAIELPYPDNAPAGRFRALLTLFIEPSGEVRRVRSEGEPLPSSLDDAARQAFLAARFTPGTKDGQPVRSRIRVEVEYVAETVDRLSASAELAH